MHIKSFTRPQLSIVTNPGTGITLTLNNAGVSIDGDWRYRYKWGL